MNTGESRQVSWWSVHEFVTAALSHAEVSSWPVVGTPTWCSLADGDPRKWASLFDAAQHWALRVECSQAIRAEASRDVSGAADWPAIAVKLFQRSGVYIPRRAS